MGSIAPGHHKVIVVGAGINGIALAKTYLDIDPLVDILLVDSELSIGGVWSKERIYPGLHYEVPVPLLDFSDLGMCEEFGMKKWDEVTGYRVRYATRFDIIRRCRFKTTTQKVERNGAGWKILVHPRGLPDAPLETLTCDKLVLATGITSVPHLPDYDLGTYDGLSFHSVEMGQRNQELTSDSVNHVTVIGGHKSALEVVGTCALAGKKVEWLIRADGGGPTWLMPSRDPSGVSLAKISTIRATAFMSSSIYRSNKWLDRFLHSKKWWLGTWLKNRAWAKITTVAIGDKYTKSENGAKLKPQPDSIQWFAPGATVTHSRDLKTLKIIDEGELVHVNRAHPTSTKGRFVTLSTGETIATDAMVWCTGWTMSNIFLCEPDLADDVGLPLLHHCLPEESKSYWEPLDNAAEIRLLELYPAFKEAPEDLKRDLPVTPFRLFRFIVPPKLAANGDNSLVILGSYANGRVQTTAEIISLWAVAYMEDLLPPATKAQLRDIDSMNKDIAHVAAYGRTRFLGLNPYRLAIFEGPEFDDQYMNDLGLRADRKRMRMPTGWRGWFGLKAWYAEWFEAYFATDYKGIVKEFMATVERRKMEAESLLDGEANGHSNEAFVEVTKKD